MIKSPQCGVNLWAAPEGANTSERTVARTLAQKSAARTAHGEATVPHQWVRAHQFWCRQGSGAVRVLVPGGIIRWHHAWLTGDRLYTRWLRILGPGAPAVPLLAVTLTRTGNDVMSVKAEVRGRSRWWLVRV